MLCEVDDEAKDRIESNINVHEESLCVALHCVISLIVRACIRLC